jgi:hypothetical protein
MALMQTFLKLLFFTLSKMQSTVLSTDFFDCACYSVAEPEPQPQLLVGAGAGAVTRCGSGYVSGYGSDGSGSDSGIKDG